MALASLSAVRSARFPDCFSDVPGPGAYSVVGSWAPVDDGLAARKAPFQTSQPNRVSEQDQAFRNPGPGVYDTPADPGLGRPCVANLGASGAVAAFRGQPIDFGELEDSGGPGPGAYTSAAQLGRPWRPRAQGRGDGTWGRVAVATDPARALCFAEPSEPSSPIGGRACRGVDFHSSKQERMGGPSASVAAPDPGEYRQPRTSSRCATAWSRDQSYRTALAKEEFGPGPTTYTLPSSEAPDADGAPASPTAVMRSTTGRWVALDGADSPGPGSYEPAASSSSSPPRRARSTYCVERPRDFHGVHEQGRLMELRGSDGRPLNAFGTRDQRFQHGESRGEGCAPGTYDRESAAGQSIEARQKAHALRNGKRGAFDTTAERWASIGSVGPGPAKYKVNVRPQSSGAGNGGLRSKGKHFESVETCGPAPGSYEAPQCFAQAELPSKSNWRRPKTAHLHFGRAGERWECQERQAAPGPGEYQVQDVVKHRGSVPKSTDARIGFSTSKDAAAQPGPGSYNVSRSLVKSSFNTSSEAFARQAQAVGCGAAALGRQLKAPGPTPLRRRPHS
eukprot:CAMPEP_0203942510 /NCGR_PEP_ID=MMETSP0359-20131031/78679_1 /ASSEMBLY_ACC=CAM_ASM_000338 /TAXON_ID=268821 /ORGANISM="Scrippsiella Hangoei, Strain SHTV-5" /LENGTH=562 /DNA_ID=CAMNT_0050873231 /DNA_START=64 /DNA_END=1749 /DNA_ORIENTATION=+